MDEMRVMQDSQKKKRVKKAKLFEKSSPKFILSRRSTSKKAEAGNGGNATRVRVDDHMSLRVPSTSEVVVCDVQLEALDCNKLGRRRWQKEPNTRQWTEGPSGVGIELTIYVHPIIGCFRTESF